MGLQWKVSWLLHHLLWKLEPEGCRAIYFPRASKEVSKRGEKQRTKMCTLWQCEPNFGGCEWGFWKTPFYYQEATRGPLAKSLRFWRISLLFLDLAGVLFKIEVRHSMWKGKSRWTRIPLNLSSIFGYITSATKFYPYCFRKPSFAFSYLKKVQ